MKPDRSLPFLRILAKVLGLVGHRAPLALASFSITSIGLSAATLMVYHQVEQLISLLNKSESISELVGRIVVLGVVLMILVLIGIVQDPLALYFRQTGIRVAMEAMHEKIERLELIDFETLDANERIDLAKSGIEGALTMLMTFLFPAFQLVFFVMAAAYLYTLSPLLAVVVPLVFLPRIISHIVHGSRYYRLERRTVPALREFQYLERCLVDREYFKETRTLGAGAQLLQRYRSVIRWFNMQRWHEDLHVAKIDVALNILVLGGYGGSFVLAALLLANGGISTGGFAVAVFALNKLMLMTNFVMDTVVVSYRRSATAAHLFEFLFREEGRPLADGVELSTPGHLQAHKVTFSYPGSDNAAINGVSVDIQRGTTVALVGTNGAGKTTLAKLLLGLYVPTSGRILRGSADTRTASQKVIRADTSAVFQNFQRYQMSLRENVILSDVTNADAEERLAEVLAAGGVPEELWQGDGLDVMLSREFGTRDLSLGQWQRLAIARGLFRRHGTILLDEPTASIDPLEEQAVYERFMKIAAGRTAIVVTHRLGSARLADRILVLDGGRIVEDGTHQDLIQQRGLYHEMYVAQAAWYKRGPE